MVTPPSLADAPVPAPGDTEVMIWMDAQGGVVPAGQVEAYPTIDGNVYSMYCSLSSSGGGVTITFYPGDSLTPTGITASNINVQDFVSYLESLNNPACNNSNAGNSPLGPTWYLRQIPVGFEIWNGGGLEADSFATGVT